MATFYKFNSFVEAVMEGKHNFSDAGGDTLKIALCAAANAPVATNTVLANLTTISPYTNLTTSGAGDRALTIASSSQTSGTYSLVLNDITLTASGGAVSAFQYIVVYNSSATNSELVGWVDRGSEITLADTQQLLLDFDNVNGLFTFT